MTFVRDGEEATVTGLDHACEGVRIAAAPATVPEVLLIALSDDRLPAVVRPLDQRQVVVAHHAPAPTHEDAEALCIQIADRALLLRHTELLPAPAPLDVEDVLILGILLLCRLVAAWPRDEPAQGRIEGRVCLPGGGPRVAILAPRLPAPIVDQRPTPPTTERDDAIRVGDENRPGVHPAGDQILVHAVVRQQLERLAVPGVEPQAVFFFRVLTHPVEERALGLRIPDPAEALLLPIRVVRQIRVVALLRPHTLGVELPHAETCDAHGDAPLSVVGEAATRVVRVLEALRVIARELEHLGALGCQDHRVGHVRVVACVAEVPRDDGFARHVVDALPSLLRALGPNGDVAHLNEGRAIPLPGMPELVEVRRVHVDRPLPLLVVDEHVVREELALRRQLDRRLAQRSRLCER